MTARVNELSLRSNGGLMLVTPWSIALGLGLPEGVGNAVVGTDENGELLAELLDVEVMIASFSGFADGRCEVPKGLKSERDVRRRWRTKQGRSAMLE